MFVVFLRRKFAKPDIPLRVAASWVFVSGHPESSAVFQRSYSQSIGKAVGGNRECQNHDGGCVR